MSFHRFITIDGKRHDITEADVFAERACDRCGTFVEFYTTVAVPKPLVSAAVRSVNPAALSAVLAGIADDPAMKVVVPIELCNRCVADRFGGLLDVALKVARDD